MPFDAGFSNYNAERLRAADTLVGRTSYEVFRSYWPAVAEDMSQPAVEREISRLNAAIERVVVSNSLKPDVVGGWGPTRVVRRADAHSEVATLKRAGSGDPAFLAAISSGTICLLPNDGIEPRREAASAWGVQEAEPTGRPGLEFAYTLADNASADHGM